MSNPNTVEKGKESTLPPIATIAAQIRDGADITVICARYRISRSTLQNRFNLAGYALSTGEPHQQRHDRPAPLQSAHIGAGGHHVGGGDHTGLPTAPVQYRGKRQHTGLDWDTLNANYTARGGQVDASVWPKVNGTVVVVRGNGHSPRANLHSFTEADEYDEPQSAAPMRVTRPKRTGAQPGAKLTHEQRVTIGRRYSIDNESLTELAKDYGVTVTTITKTLAALEIPTRTRTEAGKVRRAKRGAA